MAFLKPKSCPIDIGQLSWGPLKLLERIKILCDMTMALCAHRMFFDFSSLFDSVCIYLFF